ncbi:MAG: ArsA family ATPase [Desulfobacteraceae bacterium]|nr:ArsA family ATPase [Desulfobacteraceae bacterium]MBC2754519.1 ArsA family ATPase [Desulfobacteraceae bacterium]
MSSENKDGHRIPGGKKAGITGSSVSGEPANPWLERLFSCRLIFVMGKGGVGKTTISIALACAAERMNKKVLLAEIGDTDSIGRLYRDQALSEAPRILTQSIWGARVDPKAELEAYVRAHVTPGFIAGKIVRSRLFEYLFEATPGLKEVMSLGRLWRWEKEENNHAGATYDLIIVDAPATGHAMSLLRLPDLLINMIRVGPVANQIRGLQHLLKNHQKTSLVLVSLPEELPANEAVEFYSMAEDTLDMPVAATFINCVYPAVFNRTDLQLIESIESSDWDFSFSAVSKLIASARILNRRRIDQLKHIEEIYAKANGHVQEIPFCYTNDLTINQIQELSFFI